MIVRIFPTNEGAENTAEHPSELVTEDAVDDKVDGTVEGDHEIVSLRQRMENFPIVLKIFNRFYLNLYESGSILINFEVKKISQNSFTFNLTFPWVFFSSKI